ncbi:hypothetical protein DERF_014575 [Dermatophagoides farinae]|uniref:Uncharacterized protein n=1 Tax=Dermatophagoides farinae TaxID=6954 RepID=A0A922HME3_DERFA|nr:hypothetical protein DERF_014575 [Dermatophagoides farinae]
MKFLPIFQRGIGVKRINNLKILDSLDPQASSTTNEIIVLNQNISESPIVQKSCSINKVHDVTTGLFAM